jgi:serine/threonine protein kinase
MVRLGDTLVGRYRIDARIGAGGFATVFRARDIRLERDVAVKVLLPEHASDAEVVARFDREARALATFSHPNVVAIHDVEPATPSVGAVSFLVMDLCEGGSLAERFAASGTGGLRPEILVPILADVARGLAALHAAGVIHRDVKPSNVLLTGGRALIGDLGIAVATAIDSTGSRDAIGTLPYLAPEQLAGAPATFASDVHALGVVAYLGFTGQLPRAAGSFGELLEASTRPVPSISSLAPDLGTPFDRPVATALASDPAQRPSVVLFGSRLEGGLDRWRETGASRMTGLAVAPIVAASIAESPSGAAGRHDLADAKASSPGPDDPTVLDASMLATRRLDLRTTPSSASPGVAGHQERRGATGRDPGNRWRRAIGALIIGSAVIIGVVLLVAAFAPNLDDHVGSASASTGSTGSLAPTATASATPSPTVTPSPSPSAAPTQADPYAAAIDASRQMHAAIAAARGHSGLNGREAKQVDKSLDEFDRAVQKRDAEDARRAAAAEADAVDRLVQRREVDEQAGARMQNAAADLLAAAAELPD